MQPERVTVLNKNVSKDSNGLMRVTKMSRALRSDLGHKRFLDKMVEGGLNLPSYQK